MSWLSRAWGKLTGKSQYKKAKRGFRQAQAHYDNARNLKTEYRTNIEPKINNLNNLLRSSVQQRHIYSNQLSMIKNNANYLGNNIRNMQSRLSNIAQKVQDKNDEYQANIDQHKQEVANFNESGASLQKLIDVFKRDAPEFSKSIAEYQNLPNQFLSDYEA